MRALIRTLIFFIPGLFFSLSTLLAQQEVNVNASKGLMTTTIPVYSFDISGFKVPIGISYAARGFRVNDPGASFVGWTGEGGGTIIRIVRGLPDEINESYFKGWNFNSLFTVPTSFTPADDNDENNCNDEATNHAWLSSNYGTDKDLQPDIFVVNAPGLNCRIMRDNQGVLRAIPAQDIKIELNVLSPSDMDFVITTNNGIRYTFNLNSVASKTVVPGVSNYDLFRDEINNYQYGESYIDCWYLTKIEVLGAGKYSRLDYAYTPEYYKANVEPLNILVKDGILDTARESNIYELRRSSSNRRKIQSITSSLGPKAVFEGAGDVPSSIKVYFGAEPDRPFDRQALFEGVLAYDSASNVKQFLASVTISGQSCNIKRYKFKYYGVPETPESGVTLFPLNPACKKTDAWGFLNGSAGQSPAPKIHIYPALKATTGVYRPYPIAGYAGTSYVLPGNDKRANENTIAYGSLSRIDYPYGGSSSFEYECNSFLDQDANAEVKGAGMRIKAINHFDGLNTGTVMRKEFSYKNDAGITSGTINILPSYALSTPYYKNPITGETKIYSNIVLNFGLNSLNYWNYLTVRTNADLYNGESNVTYSQVTTMETGNGKIKQVFSTAKSFWDTSTSILSYPAESCTAGNSTFIVKGYYQYPFAPIEHWASADLMAEYVYNESGNLLKKNEYEYENYHPSAQRIYAILRDNNLGLKQFSKYYIEIIGKVLKKSKETTYDSHLSGNGLLTQIDYDNSGFNRKVRSSLITNSDLTQVKTTYKYCGDFGPFQLSDQGNPFLDGVFTAYQNNFRDEILEQMTEIQPGGTGNFKLISAQAKLYHTKMIAGLKLPVLKELRGLSHLDGITDFSGMQITGSFPTRALSMDARYQTKQIYTNHSNALMAGTVTQNRLNTAVISDSLLRAPMLQVSGATFDDVYFCNFDRMDATKLPYPGYTWQDVFSRGPYFGRSLKFGPPEQISGNFSRKTENRFYKFAFLARTDTATQINLTINNVAVCSVAVPVSNNFRFYEKTIDLSAITTGALKITANSSAIVDNVILYPADAQFIAANYDPVCGKTMEMSSSGSAKLYDYIDGIPSAERDLQENITKAYFQNNFSAVAVIPFNASITVLNPTKGYIGRTMKFMGAGSCLPGTKYVWNFGDGSILESFDQNVTHVYTSPATYTVSLTLQHPEYSSHTNTQSLLIRPEPTVSANICASGIIRYNPCYGTRIYSTCGSTPGNIDAPDGTRFRAIGIGCPTGGYTYQWQVSYDGITYEDYTYNATNFTFYLPISQMSSDYYVRCRVNAEGCDVVRYTNPMLIEINCDVI